MLSVCVLETHRFPHAGVLNDQRHIGRVLLNIVLFSQQRTYIVMRLETSLCRCPLFGRVTYEFMEAEVGHGPTLFAGYRSAST